MDDVSGEHGVKHFDVTGGEPPQFTQADLVRTVRARMERNGTVASIEARQLLSDVSLAAIAPAALVELAAVGLAFLCANVDHKTRTDVAACARPSTRLVTPGLRLRDKMAHALADIVLYNGEGVRRSLLVFTVADWTWLRDQQRTLATAASGRAALADAALAALDTHGVDTAAGLPAKERDALAELAVRAW